MLNTIFPGEYYFYLMSPVLSIIFNEQTQGCAI